MDPSFKAILFRRTRASQCETSTLARPADITTEAFDWDKGIRNRACRNTLKVLATAAETALVAAVAAVKVALAAAVNAPLSFQVGLKVSSLVELTDYGG